MYAGNDPVNMADPNGTFPCAVTAGVGALVGGIGYYVITEAMGGDPTLGGVLKNAASGAVVGGLTCGVGLLVGWQTWPVAQAAMSELAVNWNLALIAGATDMAVTSAGASGRRGRGGGDDALYRFRSRAHDALPSILDDLFDNGRGQDRGWATCWEISTVEVITGPGGKPIVRVTSHDCEGNETRRFYGIN